MKSYVIIPSRYGSKRFQGKPLAHIAGKSMIQRVYEKAEKAKNITDVYVATDDERILNAVKAFGGNVIMTSEDNRSGTDRVAQAAEKIGLDLEDIVVNIQGDQPLFDPRCIKDLVQPFYDQPGLEMSTLAFKTININEITNPKHVKVTFDNDGYALYFSRLPIPFCRDGSTSFNTFKHLGFYAYSRHFLEVFRKLPAGKLEMIEKLEQLRALEYGHKILVKITEYDSPEVDLPEDVARIEKMLI